MLLADVWGWFLARRKCKNTFVHFIHALLYKTPYIGPLARFY